MSSLRKREAIWPRRARCGCYVLIAFCLAQIAWNLSAGDPTLVPVNVFTIAGLAIAILNLNLAIDLEEDTWR